MIRLAALLIPLLLAACAGGTIDVPSTPVAGARMPAHPIPARLVLPAGPGPHPAVILLHGCGGPGNALSGAPAHLTDWANRVVAWGYAAVIPDSFAPRGVGNVCAPADQPKVTVTDRAGDAVAIARYLRTRPDIAANRIAVVGFSHGGATAQRVTVNPVGPAARGLFRAAVDYYGSCVGAPSYNGIPLLSLAGADDDWGNPAATCRTFDQAVGAGAPVQAVAYPGVVHSFDSPAARTRVMNNGHALQYDQAAAEDSFRRTRAFLDKYLH